MFSFDGLNHKFQDVSWVKCWIAFLILVVVGGVGLHPKLGSTFSGLLFFTGVVLGWKRVSLKRAEKYLLGGLVVFFLSLLPSVFGAVDADRAMSKLGRYAPFLLVVPCYWMLRYYGLQYLDVLKKGIIFGTLCLFMWGVYDTQVLNVYRAGGVMNAIMYGNLAALYAGFLFLSTLQCNNHKTIYLVFFIFALIACWWSHTRGAWLAVLIAPFMVLAVLGSWRVRGYGVLIGGAILGFIAVGIYYEYSWFVDVSRGLNELKLFLSDPSVCSSWGARLNMWRNSVIMISDTPLWGVGLGGYQAGAKALVDSGVSYMSCPVVYQHTAHSIYFHILAEAGLIGLLGLLVMFACILYAVIASGRSKHQQAFSLLCVFMFMVMGISTTWLAKSLSLSLFIVFVLLLLADLYCEPSEKA